MNKTKQTTTVCVDCDDRDVINAFAEKLDISQRQMVSRLIETYRASRAKKDSGPPEDLLERLAKDIEKVLERDSRIVGFIRTQEKELLKPILEGVLSNDAQIKLLNQILSNLS